MSDRSNQSQQNIIHKNYGLLSQNINLPQVTSLSNEPMASLSEKINKNDEGNNYSQQLRETHIEIKLDDCMQCFINISRCEIIKKENEQEDHYSDRNTQLTIAQQIRERKEEEEKLSPKYPLQQVSTPRHQVQKDEKEEEEEEEEYSESGLEDLENSLLKDKF